MYKKNYELYKFCVSYNPYDKGRDWSECSGLSVKYKNVKADDVNDLMICV